MKQQAIPYKKTVFVCTYRREDGRAACANDGQDGEAICKALKEGVEKAGLKLRIRVARSGCLDVCEKGPNLFIQPTGEWFSGLTLADVPELLKKIAA